MEAFAVYWNTSLHLYSNMRATDLLDQFVRDIARKDTVPSGFKYGIYNNQTNILLLKFECCSIGSN